MSQLENKMDDFVPFGGQARTEYQEDDRTVPMPSSMHVSMRWVKSCFP